MIGPVTAPELHLMTWNTRTRNAPHLGRNPHPWARRRPLLEQRMRDERPTLLAVQEADDAVVHALAGALGDGHRWIGRGRNADGLGERCAIVWDDTRLRLVGWRQWALSRRPGRPGSRSWGSAWPRIVVRARFADRATGAPLTVLATHLDPVSPVARLRQARLVADIAAQQRGPVVVLGDVNAAPGSRTWDALLARPDGARGHAAASGGRGLADAWTAAAEHATPEWGTYTGYRGPRTTDRGGARIDALLVRGLEVRRAAIGAVDGPAGGASDHAPVHAVVRAASA